MPAVCEFVFARATPIYYSGEQIVGSVRYTPNKRLTLTAIKLTLTGGVQVEWQQSFNAPQSIEHNDCSKLDNRICCSGRQEYFRTEKRLAECLTLEPNRTFVQPFCFTVPEDCAATCKLNHGEVAYQLQLTLQRKSTFNKIYQQRVVIKRRLDLNEQLKLKQPHSVSIKDKSDCSIKFDAPRTGFVPGQHIPCSMTFEPGVEQRQIYINLCQVFLYQCFEPAQRTKEVIRILASQKIQSSQLQWEGALKIPLEVPITTTSEGLIRISYHLAAVILTDKRKIWQKLIIPITIGSVPLQATPTTTATTALPTATTITNLLAENYAHSCYDNFATTERNCPAEEFVNDLKFAVRNSMYSDHSNDFIYQKEPVRISVRIKLLTFRNNKNTFT